MKLRFSKYEGLGNDFLLVSREDVLGLAGALTPAEVARLCDRHFGVGGDGVLIVGSGPDGLWMNVINADGSTPEMCGNGLRCVALYLIDEGLVTERRFVVQTDAGPHTVEVDRTSADTALVKVEMRPASLAAGEVLRDASGEWIERTFSCDNRDFAMTAVSMGNPHAVLFQAGGFSPAEMAALGPRIEKDPRFSAGANVGFARLESPTKLDLTVWERGVGFTLACGTGACAAAVAAVETGRSPRGSELTVQLPGGPLRIRVGERAAPIEMTGPARRVFDGEVVVGGAASRPGQAAG
ncbi:MAG TPA: diaminopimelate epimerase [Polyangiales bacterium]